MSKPSFLHVLVIRLVLVVMLIRTHLADTKTIELCFDKLYPQTNSLFAHPLTVLYHLKLAAVMHTQLIWVYVPPLVTLTATRVILFVPIVAVTATLAIESFLLLVVVDLTPLCHQGICPCRHCLILWTIWVWRFVFV